MPAFKYEALDAAGKTKTGLVEADNAKAARASVRAKGLLPVSVDAVQGGNTAADGSLSFKQRWLMRKAFSTTELTVWTRQLAGLVISGLPLERALTALTDEAETPAQRDVVAHLRSEVNAGNSFARAMATLPREFDDVYRAVVAAGEQSGALGQVLERLATDLEERQALKAKVVGAMLYPAIVSVIAMVIVTFLLAYVVPQVASVFATSKQVLPLLTRIMMTASDLIRQWGWLMALAVIGAVFMLRAALKSEPFRQRFDAGVLRLPLFGRLARGYNSARFAGTLAMLAGAGVPILKALQAAAETLSNHAMRADAMDALVQVREGAPLASALAAKKRFPGLLAMFARLGEQTGQLPAMLERSARQLSAEVQRRAMAIATLLEPLLIVAMGAVVMLIVLSILMPILQMNQLVR